MIFFAAFTALLPLTQAAPAVIKHSGSGGNSCTFTNAAAVVKGKASCSTITLSNIAVPAGVTLDLTGLNAGTKVIFDGSTTFGFKKWKGPLISVSGTGLTVTGTPGHVLDGGGKSYWDKLGLNGGMTKPKFFAAHQVHQSTIQGLNVKNSPVQFMSINMATDLRVLDVNYDNSAGDAGELGHNTDAFDIGSSSNILISGAYVHNQDDCLAINSGTNITFINSTCLLGHGVSIGSVGFRESNIVDTVLVQNVNLVGSDNGIRIKTISKATGKVMNIAYKDIVLSDIAKFGIVIEQDYLNGSPTGVPTAGVPITGLTISNVTGTVSSSGVIKKVLCAQGACSGWKWDAINLTGGQKTFKCLNIPNGADC